MGLVEGGESGAEVPSLEVLLGVASVETTGGGHAERAEGVDLPGGLTFIALEPQTSLCEAEIVARTERWVAKHPISLDAAPEHPGDLAVDPFILAVTVWMKRRAEPMEGVADGRVGRVLRYSQDVVVADELDHLEPSFEVLAARHR